MSTLPRQFQIVDTHDPDEFVEALAPYVGRISANPRTKYDKFHCRIDYLALGDVGIFNGEYESGLEVRFADFNSFAGSISPLKGVGAHRIQNQEVTVSEGRGVVVSPGGVTLRYGRAFEHLSVIVPPAVLMSHLASIVGELRLGPLRFEPSVDGHNPMAERLGRLLRYVSNEAGLGWPLAPVFQSELERTIKTAFLLAGTNNYSALLNCEPVAPSPWQVGLAEQFIEANWDKPFSIEALVAATGVSARSLFYTFKANRGCSPMEFVKRVRLGHARDILLRPDDQTSVTTVAFRCGFGNAGHFSRDYRLQFGELPSQTLCRGRGNSLVSRHGVGKA